MTTKALVMLSALPLFALAAEETERDAVLLECCSLPDKQLTLTEADLDGIVSRFSPNVPVKLQHTDTALDPFGVVKSVQRVGKQLLGKLSFAPAIAALVRERGALALSCGLDRSPLALAEVSLVIKGRLPAAVLLSNLQLSADDAAELAQLRLDNARILADANTLRVDAQIVTLKLAGKIVPATEAAARVLLSAGDSSQITLAGGNSLSTAEAFTAFLAAHPPLITLGQLTQLSDLQLAGVDSQADGNASTILTQDQREWLEKSLGVKADDVVKTMDAGKRKTAGQARGPAPTHPMGGM